MPGTRSEFEALLKRLAAPPLQTWGDARVLGEGSLVAERYRVVRLLGQGGMGQVYEAEDTQTGMRLALKCLLPSLFEDQEARVRFAAEAMVASRLDHPNIAKVFAASSLPDGRPYLCMELIAGHSLQRVLAAEGPLCEARLLNIADSLCDALSAAHAQGLIHRDLKPGNVILIPVPGQPEGVKLADFGISKRVQDPTAHVTTTGVVVGTPHFMSPEQVRGDRHLDGRCDLYALGVLLYCCATGVLPFEGKGFAELAMQICSATPTAPRVLRPELSPDLEAVIQTAMARDREARFQSAAMFKAALDQVLGRGMDRRCAPGNLS